MSRSTGFLRTSEIVHASEVDTCLKRQDKIRNLVLRLERRAGRRIPWVAIGPLLIRRSRCFRESAGCYLIQVISCDLGWCGGWN